MPKQGACGWLYYKGLMDFHCHKNRMIYFLAGRLNALSARVLDGIELINETHTYIPDSDGTADISS